MAPRRRCKHRPVSSAVEPQQLRQQSVENGLVVRREPADALLQTVPVQVADLEAEHDAPRAKSVLRGRFHGQGALEAPPVEVAGHRRDDAEPVIGLIGHDDAGPPAGLVVSVLMRQPQSLLG